MYPRAPFCPKFSVLTVLFFIAMTVSISEALLTGMTFPHITTPQRMDGAPCPMATDMEENFWRPTDGYGSLVEGPRKFKRSDLVFVI
jgi:hypothetical protein